MITQAQILDVWARSVAKATVLPWLARFFSSRLTGPVLERTYPVLGLGAPSPWGAFILRRTRDFRASVLHISFPKSHSQVFGSGPSLPLTPSLACTVLIFF